MRSKRRRVARWSALGALVIVAALVAVLATRPPDSYTEVATPLIGKQAPSVEGATLRGGNFELSSLRGRWVLLNFFASWCPPCQQEEPELVKFAYEHEHEGTTDVAVVGVVFDDSDASARQFLDTAGASWPAVTDPGGQIALDYGVRGPPETFLISPSGLVVAHLDGAVTDSGLDHYLAQEERDV